MAINILDQLLASSRGGPREEDDPNKPNILANLLAQALPAGASAAPERDLLRVLAKDMGVEPDDVEAMLMGQQNLINMGDKQTPSLLEGLANDRGLPVQDMRDVIRGNNNLANVDATKRGVNEAREDRIRWDTAEASRQDPVELMSSSPEVDSVLDSLLEQARRADQSNDPKIMAHFASKISSMQHSPDASPQERVAAFQFRQPDMAVSMQTDGVMSFSDQGKLKVTDAATRKAVDRFRSKLETISPDNPIIVGEGTKLAAFGAYTRQRGADRAVQARTDMFGPTNSRSSQRMQQKLQGIMQIDDPNERVLSLARLGPQIAEFQMQRQSEIRQEVFGEYRIDDLNSQMRNAEAEDRADPRYEEFNGADSPNTARIRQQLRVAQSDALGEIDNRFKTDPLVSTLNSQARMTEVMVNQQNKTDSGLQLTDTWELRTPAEQTRAKVAARALFPDKAASGLGSTEMAKIMAIDQPFFDTVMSFQKPSDFLSAMAVDSGNRTKWEAVINTMEADAGGDDYTRKLAMDQYKRIANSTASLFSGTEPSEKTRADLGGSIRGLYEQYAIEKRELSPAQLAARVQGYYVPKAIEAELDYLQTNTMLAADQTTRDLTPTTRHKGVNELLVEAGERDFSIADLMNPHMLKSLGNASAETRGLGGTGRYGLNQEGSGITIKGPSLLLQDPLAREAMARFIADKRKASMLSTALIKPIDTYEQVLRQLSVNSIIGR
jgi:hypothetical protein